MMLDVVVEPVVVDEASLVLDPTVELDPNVVVERGVEVEPRVVGAVELVVVSRLVTLRTVVGASVLVVRRVVTGPLVVVGLRVVDGWGRVVGPGMTDDDVVDARRLVVERAAVDEVRWTADVVEGDRKVVGEPIPTRVVEVDTAVVSDGAVVEDERPVSDDDVGARDWVVDGPPASGSASESGATEKVVGPVPSPVVGEELPSRIVV